MIWLYTWKWALIGVAFAGVLAALGYERVQVSDARSALAVERQGRSDDRASAERVARDAEAAYRITESITRSKQMEALDAQRKERDIAVAAVAASDDSVRRMRAAIAAINTTRRGAAPRDPAVAVSGPATPDADMVPAILLDWIDGRARELAALVDESRAAGELCVRYYSSLTPD